MTAPLGGNGKEKESSKYKAYAQAVDRALKTFENPNEWADLISALGKLAKVFQSNAKFASIPKPVTVAKRLSQCLHPALPMGVHMKALETYRQIFDILGPQALPEVLYLFAVGLFPLMDHCGIKVKSELFAIFEHYLVPLETNLRPALPGFLGGVLLGLEEGTEFYERSLVLLDNVCEKVGPRAFFACLWQAVLGSPPVRLPAMIYVNNKYEKSRTFDDQIFIVGDHVNHMVAALCATADDVGSPLVQRYLLDFLVAAFPMDSSNLTDVDFVQLLRRCLFVVLRRDVSLNRRLYTWLINRSGESRGVSGLSLGGPDDGLDLSFFRERVLPLVTAALDQYLQLDQVSVSPSHSSSAIWGEKKEAEQVQFAEVRVCRLLLYLQDRADVGKLILEAVFPVFLRNVARYHTKYGKAATEEVDDDGKGDSVSRLYLNLKTSASTTSIERPNAECTSEDAALHERRCDEMTKTFNMLLNSLEAGFLWQFLSQWFEQIVKDVEINQDDDSSLRDFSCVVSMCLEIVNTANDASVRPKHLPQLLISILTGISSPQVISTCAQNDVLAVYAVCNKLLAIITSRPAAEVEVVELAEDAICSQNAESVVSVERENCEVEICLQCCLQASATIFEAYSAKRCASLFPLIESACSLINEFLNVPLYVTSSMSQEVSSVLPRWLKNILEVIDGSGWLREMRASKCADVSARAALLELLCNVYCKSCSVLEQHVEVQQRHASCDVNEDKTPIVLLKPILTRHDLDHLEREKVFENCTEAVWIGVGSRWCCREQQRLARLLIQLHSRRPNEPSSEVENVVVQALTSSDDLVCTEAAKTFHRVWVLTRNSDDEGVPMYMKPFNRIVMILLGVLADESVSRARTELKAAASAWFADCAKHNDLPRIVQMLATMLLNPVTARISIQFLRQEAKMTNDTCPALPADTCAVTLLTADGKQRLYHVDGPCDETSQWLSEVRYRLLLSSNEESDIVRETRQVSPCNAPIDVPNFDDDTDSLDTLSLNADGIDVAVYETVMSLVDVVCEHMNEDDDRDRINAAVAGKVIDPTGASFSLRDEDESTIADESVTLCEETPMPVNEHLLRVKRGHRRQDSLQESIFSMTEKDLKAFDASEIFRPSTESNEGGASGQPQNSSSGGTLSSTPIFDELHIHMLLYGESGRTVDLGRAETAFRILTALLAPRGTTGNRMLLNCLVTSGTAASCSSEEPGNSLVELMNRHVRAILGQHFWSPSDENQKHRHLTLLELLLTISLHYLRSYFLNSPISPVTEADLASLWKCKISALEFLSELIREISAMLGEQESRSFVVFVQSILARAKLQKCLLHMMLTAVDHDPTGVKARNGTSLSISISAFNEGLMGGIQSNRLSPLLSAYHRSLLSLTARAIRLESDIKNGFSSFHDSATGASISRRLSLNHQLYGGSASRSSSREPHASLVELRAFLVIILNALKKQPQRHEMWLQFVIQILPWMERSLATVVCRVIEQLCKNIEAAMSVAYVPPVTSEVAIDSPAEKLDPEIYPANYLVMTLESLTTLVHFCVIDAAPTAGSSTIQTPVSSAPTSMVGHAMSVIPGSKVATELFSTLGKVFSMSGDSSGVGMAKMESNRQHGNGWRQAQSDMLSQFPHSLATICNIWTLVRTQQTPSVPLGTVPQLRQLVLHLLSPIAQNHEHAFLTSLALVWLTRSSIKPTLRRNDPDQAVFEYSHAQKDIANLLLSLKVIPLEDLISSVNTTLKDASLKANKVGITIDKANFPTEEPLLEMVHACVSSVPQSQLRLCWSSLLPLFNDAPLANLSPRAIFLLFVILCDFVKSVGGAYIVEEKAMSRNVHDICARLADAVNVIVGWQLETTTWLKRTLVVKHDHTAASTRSVDQSPIVETAGSMASFMSYSTVSIDQSTRNSSLSLVNKPPSLDVVSTTSGLGEKYEKKSSSNLRASIKDTNNNKRDPAHSTQALFLLSQRLTELLDSVSKSDDKERVLPILYAVWANVVPYLKAKNARNARFFLASSQLLASMSSYSYMRPVWKKTTLELLLDSSFFKMDHQALKQWLIVTDHLMTHDRTSFKDLLKSIAYTPNASFSIMTSKEQEYEARGQALKRLAFVVFGSQLDQYHAQMNDIQERLSDNLRVSQSPVIRTAVFLCIRVLLLRLRPQSLIGVWPIMVTELVHVLLQLEQQLSSERESIEELASARDDHWMQLYLAACKLLETLCSLPAGYLAHFQMCHWAFASSVSSESDEKFKPFADRINELLSKKYGELTATEMSTQSASLASIKILTTFEELRPFFYALANLNKSVPGVENNLRDSSAFSGSLSHKNAISRLESALYVDFAEHLQL